MPPSPTPPRRTMSPELRITFANEASDKNDQPNASEDPNTNANANEEAASSSTPARGQENRRPITPTESPSKEAATCSSSPSTPTLTISRANRHQRTLAESASKESARNLELPPTPRVACALPARHGRPSQTTISSAYRLYGDTVQPRPEDLPETETFGASGITIDRRPERGGPTNNGSGPPRRTIPSSSPDPDTDSVDHENENENENDRNPSETHRTPVPDADSTDENENKYDGRPSGTRGRSAIASLPRFAEADTLPPPYTPHPLSNDSHGDSPDTKKRKQSAGAETQDNRCEPDSLASEGIVVGDSRQTNAQADGNGGRPKKKKGKTAVCEPVGRLILDSPRPPPRRHSPNRGRRLRTIAQTGFQSHAFTAPGDEDLETVEQVLHNEDNGDGETVDAQRPPTIPIRYGSVAQFPAESVADRLDARLRERHLQQIIAERLQAHEQAADNEDDTEEDAAPLSPEAGIQRDLDGELWNDNPPFPGNA